MRQLFIHFLTQRGKRFTHKKQKVVLARTPYKHLPQPARAIALGETIRACAGSVVYTQSMWFRCWLGQRGQLFTHRNSQ